MNINNTSFLYTLEKETTRILDEFKAKPRRALRPHQHLLIQFMRGKITHRMPRGVLVMDEMGTGKTITSISVALALPNKIIVILSRSLVANFKAEIAKYAKYSGMRQPLDEIMQRFAFVSLNASNMIAQLKKVSGGSLSGNTIIVDEAHNLFRQIINGANKNGPVFYNMVMSTPDIRLLFLTGTPINKDPYELVPCFNMLVGFALFPPDYEDFKSLFIGGSIPEIDEDLGMVPPPSGSTEQTGYVKNRPKFQNRLSGLISYVEGNPADFPNELESTIEYVPLEYKKQWPAYVLARLKEKAETKRSNKKVGDKLSIRDKQAGIGLQTKKMATSYRKESRSICNAFEDVSPKIDKLLSNINEIKGKGLIYSQFIGSGLMKIAERLEKEGWEPIVISVNNANMHEMDGGNSHQEDSTQPRNNSHSNDINNIEMNKSIINQNIDGEFIDYDTSQQFMYGSAENNDDESVFTTNNDESDVDNIADETDMFELVKYPKPEDDKMDPDDATVDTAEDDANVIEEPQDGNSLTDKKIVELIESDTIKGLSANIVQNKKRFVMIYGEVKPEDRQKLQNLFNQDNNINGEKIGLFLVSSTGAEGLNLRAVRHVHIFEPYWSYSRIGQVKARARRFMSHSALPPEERNFKTFIYISVPPKQVTDFDEPTTDQDLYSMALRRQVVIDDFLLALKEISYNCPHTHTKLNCVKCSPTNQPLYTRDIYSDIAAVNPCVPAKSTEIKVNTIEIDGQKYKWTTDTEEAKQSIYEIAIYKWDAKLKSYIKISESNDIYEKIYKIFKGDKIINEIF